MRAVLARMVICAAAAGLAGHALAEDKVRAAVGQRGNWDTLIISQGTEAGIFKREGVEVDITWTRGGAETLQAVITDSADVAIANGILGVIGPLRMNYSRIIPIVNYTARAVIDLLRMM